MLTGRGRFAAEQPAAGRRIEVVDPGGRVTDTVDADVVLLATGATPRVLPDAVRQDLYQRFWDVLPAEHQQFLTDHDSDPRIAPPADQT